MLLWIPYAVALGLLLTAAAWLVDRLPPTRGVPGRWIWASALVASVVAPMVLPLVAPRGAAASAWVGTIIAIAGPATAGGDPLVSATAAAWIDAADRLLRLGWLLAALALLGSLAVRALRLHARVSRWPRRWVDGGFVRVGGLAGPAVVGVREPEVVVPAWVLEMPAADRRLILAHERAHVAARDPALMWGAWILAAAVPWNPALWLQLRRLRGTMEEDCDRRVIRGRPWADARRYGELLVDVGARVGPGTRRLAPAAFAEGGSHLERRIRTMYNLYPPLSRLRVFLAGLGAVGLVAVGLWMPRPAAAPSDTADRADVSDEVAAAGEPVDVSSDPSFTPYTVRPGLTNRAEVAQALTTEYPPLLRDAGIGGTATVWLFVDEQGRTRNSRLATSSGHSALDDAALVVADRMRFTPARNRDEAVSAWVQLPIAFGVR